ncbi:hydrolase [Gracilimonas sp.]|uniref:hydrolase n=1 Tax=Gracilimonas sp. TaxID=1974203 RepID=UPI0028714F7E|nr:hypothetical protein [Gracilimonas sp.]
MDLGQNSLLSANKFTIPESIHSAPGISLKGKLIKSVLLSTDLTYIQNLDMDAVMILNPFEKSNELDEVIIQFSNKPVFCDVGGGFLREEQTMRLARGAFEVGAAGVLISKPTAPEIIRRVKQQIQGELIYTVMFEGEPIRELVDAGVDMFNVSTGETTSETVAEIRTFLPDVAIMANGGPHNSTIRETISNGADAIVLNPPTATEILRSVFDNYRNNRG